MKYWIILNGTQFGPMEAEELIAMHPTLESPVWHEGLEKWVALRNVALLHDMLLEAQQRASRAEEPSVVIDDRTECKITEEKPECERTITVEDNTQEPTRREENRNTNGQPQYRQPQYGQSQYGQSQYGQPQYSQPQYGQQYPYNGNNGYPDGQYPPCPPTYLVWSILSIFLCCIPLGIVAVIYSSKVRPAYDRGDYAGACRASETAMWWLIATIILGLISAPFFFIFSLM